MLRGTLFPNLFRLFISCSLGTYALQGMAAEGQGDGASPKPATDITIQANQAALGTLPFSNQQDFEDATRGLIAPLPQGGVVTGDDGSKIWDMSDYAFLSRTPDGDQSVPNTVHPSLWRQSQLVATGGLFKVTDRIYQVRTLDLSNITFIEGEKGVIVLDPLISTETAKAALEFYYQHRPKKPVVAVIYSHSHVDHYGGVKGIVSDADVQAGKVAIIAPSGFLKEAVSENVFAGPVGQ